MEKIKKIVFIIHQSTSHQTVSKRRVHVAPPPMLYSQQIFYFIIPLKNFVPDFASSGFQPQFQFFFQIYLHRTGKLPLFAQNLFFFHSAYIPSRKSQLQVITSRIGIHIEYLSGKKEPFYQQRLHCFFIHFR